MSRGLGDVYKRQADYNPYEGVVTKGSIRQVWLRGKPAVSSGKVLAGPDGKYLPRGKCQL